MISNSICNLILTLPNFVAIPLMLVLPTPKKYIMLIPMISAIFFRLSEKTTRPGLKNMKSCEIKIFRWTLSLKQFGLYSFKGFYPFNLYSKFFSLCYKYSLIFSEIIIIYSLIIKKTISCHFLIFKYMSFFSLILSKKDIIARFIFGHEVALIPIYTVSIYEYLIYS